MPIRRGFWLNPEKAKTPLGEAGLSNQSAALGGIGGEKSDQPMSKAYRGSVSGVFRRNTIWFRGLWQNLGQRFAVCGNNPAKGDLIVKIVLQKVREVVKPLARTPQSLPRRATRSSP